MTARLHYIFDPLCGWCYAAAPLIQAARQVQGLEIVLHAGGMLTGARRKPVTPEWREYVLQADARIAQLSGQEFGDAYKNGLLHDASLVLDSTPPTVAILAAQALAGKGLDMLAGLQNAYYVQGRSLGDHRVLLAAAIGLGLPQDAFTQTSKAIADGEVQQHYQATHQLMEQVRAHGFPTLLLLRDVDGKAQAQRIEVSSWLGRPQAFKEALQAGMELVLGK